MSNEQFKGALQQEVIPPDIPHYRLLRLIGSGSYGHVWLAENAVGSLHAVKVIHRASFEEARPFQREFEAIQHYEPISRSHGSQFHILHVGKTEDFYSTRWNSRMTAQRMNRCQPAPTLPASQRISPAR